MELITVCLVVNQLTTEHDLNLFAENLKISGAQKEVIIYDNKSGLTDLNFFGKTIQNESIYIYSWSECVNQILRIASGNYFFLYYENAIYNQDWLKQLYNYYSQTYQSGCSSIYTEIGNVTEDYILSKSDELMPVFPSNKFQGCLFFNRSLLESIGGFNVKLSGSNACNEYILRSKSLGKMNYFVPNQSKISLSEYNDFPGILNLENQDWQNYFDPAKVFIQLFRSTNKNESILSFIKTNLDPDAIYCKYRGAVIFSKNYLSNEDISNLQLLTCNNKITIKSSSILNMGVVYSKLIALIN